jgi:hypothetical protein
LNPQKTSGYGNPCLGFEQAQNVAGLNCLMGLQHLLSSNISNYNEITISENTALNSPMCYYINELKPTKKNVISAETSEYILKCMKHI